MRSFRLLLASLFSVSALSAVTFTSSVTAGAATPSTLAACQTKINSQEYSKGKLTVATDNPVYTPWFIGNKPTNGKGFESALAYAIAKTLGVSKANVVWAYEPFDNSYTPGPKKFDARHRRLGAREWTDQRHRRRHARRPVHGDVRSGEREEEGGR
jgi:polar amino acid transport system substrate-binding protein